MKILIAALVLTVFVVPFAFGEVYSNMVGLYKIDVSNGRNLVSMPFLPFSASLDDVIGDALTGHDYSNALSDNIERWDPVGKTYERAWYCTQPGYEGWYSWNFGTAFDFNPDESYWINIVLGHPGTTITLLGEVSQVDRVINVGLQRNMVAPSFPKEMSLDDSGLLDPDINGKHFTGHDYSAALSDRIEWWDNATASYIKIWYSTYTGYEGWYNWDSSPATKKIVPGEGMWIIVNNEAFIWTSPIPY